MKISIKTISALIFATTSLSTSVSGFSQTSDLCNYETESGVVIKAKSIELQLIEPIETKDSYTFKILNIIDQSDDNIEKDDLGFLIAATTLTDKNHNPQGLSPDSLCYSKRINGQEGQAVKLMFQAGDSLTIPSENFLFLPNSLVQEGMSIGFRWILDEAILNRMLAPVIQTMNKYTISSNIAGETRDLNVLWTSALNNAGSTIPNLEIAHDLPHPFKSRVHHSPQFEPKKVHAAGKISYDPFTYSYKRYDMKYRKPPILERSHYSANSYLIYDLPIDGRAPEAGSILSPFFRILIKFEDGYQELTEDLKNELKN